MISDVETIATRLMLEFARRTGLSPVAQHPKRYLWTDAFAVCNFLELFARTDNQIYRRLATELIEQVHQVLGRYRDDDTRSGWISGLDENAGRRHPTAGGFRIGKPLKERGIDELFDERLEWDRDGQYFHYLTKWMHALCQAAFATGNTDYARWAVELADASFKAFARRSPSGEVVGIYWKMSIDRSRPLVPAMGLHDALDGFITFREAQNAAANLQATAETVDIKPAIDALSHLCRDKDWTTDDPLGLGGLLFDASRICQLTDADRPDDARLVQDIMSACRHGLRAFIASRTLNRPALHRLAFRELGLAIGLRALPIIAERIKGARRSSATPGLQSIVDMLLPYERLSEMMVNIWLPQAKQHDETWRAHHDINDVMLATALIPDTFLSVGQRARVHEFGV